jgi:tetratricopeptide (TPR) repeat protein
VTRCRCSSVKFITDYFSISFSGFKLKCKAILCGRRTASLHPLRGWFNVIAMSFGTRFFLIFALGIALGGCTQSDQDEEKEPHYVLGQSRINAMDYQGAVEAFEESLEVNPHSAAAHYQLAMLYENQQSDPAAAIYHYQQYLKFDPQAENADIIRQHIASCKQQLASDVLQLPGTPAAQEQLEKLVDQNRQLQEQVDSLQAALKQWSDWYTKYTNQLAAQTVPVVPQNNVVQQPENPGQPQQPVNTQAVNTGSQNPLPGTHTHVVERGETAMAICRKFGIRLSQLESANPTLNPTRIWPGEVLNIP